MGEAGQQAAKAALYQEGEAIMTESKRQCPVDLGNLRATGHVSQPEMQQGHITVTLAYGGPSATYAIVQHERLDFRHTVGKAKYLEDPMLAAVNGMEARLRARIKRGLEFDFET
jgi:hypothetical protein